MANEMYSQRVVTQSFKPLVSHYHGKQNLQPESSHSLSNLLCPVTMANEIYRLSSYTVFHTSGVLLPWQTKSTARVATQSFKPLVSRCHGKRNAQLAINYTVFQTSGVPLPWQIKSTARAAAQSLKPLVSRYHGKRNLQPKSSYTCLSNLWCHVTMAN